jgi:hypothetical protein
MIFTVMVFFGVILVTYVVSVAVIPRFDRQVSFSPLPESATRPNSAHSRST